MLPLSNGCFVFVGPGQQLLALREQLLRKVREQRQRSRAERQRQQCLDNEEFPPGHPDADPTSNSLPEFEEEEEEEILSDAESSVSGASHILDRHLNYATVQNVLTVPGIAIVISSTLL